MRSVLLLLGSNVFMTLAWYGHLRFKTAPLVVAILASWGIAFFEYCLQVPANRFGYLGGFTAFQLKIVQECISIVVFVAFAVAFLKETPRWNHIVALVLVVAAAGFGFFGTSRAPPAPAPATTPVPSSADPAP